VHLVVDPGEVSNSGTLTDSTELVVDGTVTKADPALVGTEIGNGNATKMGANGRAAHDGRVTGIRDSSLGLLIELSGSGKGVSSIDLGFGQTTNEDEVTVP